MSSIGKPGVVLLNLQGRELRQVDVLYVEAC